MNGPAHFRGNTAAETNPDPATLGGGNSDLLICGGGGNDSLTGGDFNDVIEAGDSGEVVLTGGAGNDYLRGTNSSNTINGGSGDDVLVAREGNDQLSGGSGTNQYLTGIDAGSDLHDTVQGGTNSDAGTDVIYFEGVESEYTLSPVCTRCTCQVEKSPTRLVTINRGETLIFAESRLDLPESEPPCTTPEPTPEPTPAPTPSNTRTNSSTNSSTDTCSIG